MNGSPTTTAGPSPPTVVELGQARSRRGCRRGGLSADVVDRVADAGGDALDDVRRLAMPRQKTLTSGLPACDGSNDLAADGGNADAVT
jgi:hypothetical protein